MNQALSTKCVGSLRRTPHFPVDLTFQEASPSHCMMQKSQAVSSSCWFGCLHWTFLTRHWHWAAKVLTDPRNLLEWREAKLTTWYISIFCLAAILWTWGHSGIPFTKNCFTQRKRNAFMCHRCKFWGQYIYLLITLQYGKWESHLLHGCCWPAQLCQSYHR